MRKLISLVFFMPLFLFGQIPSGNAIVFNGVSDYYTVTDNSSLDLSGNLTVEAWINPCDTLGDNYILTKLYCSSREYAYYFNVKNGYLRWVWDPSGMCTSTSYSLYESAVPIVKNNEWQHVALVHTPTSITIYYNGIPIAGNLTIGNYGGLIYNSAEPLRVGAYRFLGGIGGFFNGRMDEIRMWNTALTSAQILARYNTALTGSESGLMLYHNFESVSGSTINNSATSTGTINNGSNISGSPLIMANNLDYPLAFSLGNDTTFCDTNSVSISIPSRFTQFLWSDGFTSRTRTVSTTSALVATGFKDYCFTKDTFNAIVTNCDSIILPPSVIVEPCNQLFLMPNVFSPNSDGINDVFQPVVYECFILKRIKIYNRWGQIIYQSSSKIEWNGRSESGKKVSDGTYYWVVEHRDSNGNTTFEKGFVNLFQ